jgi:hypothetical protein
VAAQIRAERAGVSAADATETAVPAEPEIRIRRPRDTGERHRAAELRDRLRWAWMRPSRRYDEFKDLVAAAEEELSEQRAADLLGDDAAARLAGREPARR